MSQDNQILFPHISFKVKVAILAVALICLLCVGIVIEKNRNKDLFTGIRVIEGIPYYFHRGIGEILS